MPTNKIEGFPEEKICEHKWITNWEGNNIKSDIYFHCKKCSIPKVLPVIEQRHKWIYYEGFNAALSLCKQAHERIVKELENKISFLQFKLVRRECKLKQIYKQLSGEELSLYAKIVRLRVVVKEKDAEIKRLREGLVKIRLLADYSGYFDIEEITKNLLEGK